MNLAAFHTLPSQYTIVGQSVEVSITNAIDASI